MEVGLNQLQSDIPQPGLGQDRVRFRGARSGGALQSPEAALGVLESSASDWRRSKAQLFATGGLHDPRGLRDQLEADRVQRDRYTCAKVRFQLRARRGVPSASSKHRITFSASTKSCCQTAFAIASSVGIAAHV